MAPPGHVLIEAGKHPEAPLRGWPAASNARRLSGRRAKKRTLVLTTWSPLGGQFQDKKIFKCRQSRKVTFFKR